MKNCSRRHSAVARFMIKAIKFYQKYLSPLKRFSSCRYTPTCSEYAVQAIEKYGAFKGFWMAVRRILRCNPFAEGGYDPVP